MNQEKRIRVHPKEFEIIKEAMAAEFASPSRMATGAYVASLAKEKLEAQQERDE
jgi:hypothetical protein